MNRQVRTIDAHTAGQALRLVIDGFPTPPGRTMLDKCSWVKKHQDRVRRALLCEPRGHQDMCGAILTEPVLPGSHAGLVFMHTDGYATMCGHAVIAVTTIALERGLLMPGGDGRSIVYDTPAGVVRANATVVSAGRHALATDARRCRVASVTFLNVPSFVLHAGLEVPLGARRIRADVAFGGAFYAIVDSEGAGLPLDVAHVPELRRAGREIKRAIDEAHSIVHPLDQSLHGIYGTIFTAPPNDHRAHLRNVAVCGDQQVDRSPSGTGTAAVMAVLDAMGLLAEDEPFVHESLVGMRFSGRLTGRTQVGDYQAIVSAIEGSAWITGEHTFFIDDDDPLKDGFRM